MKDYEANLVAEEHACPRCGERHVDSLVWQDDEKVHCCNCGTIFQPDDSAMYPAGDSDTDNESPLCECGEPTCLGQCGGGVFDDSNLAPGVGLTPQEVAKQRAGQDVRTS